MRKTVIVYVLLFFVTASCSKTLEDIPSGNEVVNGFNVVWRKNVSSEKKEVIRTILNNMQFVEGGTFLMGATQEQNDFALENEYPAHYVKLSDYYICKKEITLDQIAILCDCEFSSYEENMMAPEYTWNDWKRVLSIISECSGLEFDFPTEAQWEYAARGGKRNMNHLYPGGDNVDIAANDTNELGLYDMTRGHSEWCKDYYHKYKNSALEINPYVKQGEGHVIRGGNSKSVGLQTWYSHSVMFFNYYKDVRLCRVSARTYGDESQAYLGCYISCRFVINN